MKTNLAKKVKKTTVITLLALFAVVLCGCHNKNAKHHNEETSDIPQLLQEYGCDTIVCSDDGVICCYGLSRSHRCETPHMIIQYTANGKTRWVEEMGAVEDCYLCLTPEAIYHVRDKNSTIYLVYGYGGYTGNGSEWCLKAYRLIDGFLCPTFVFDGFEYEETISVEIPSGDEDLRHEMFYYNKEDLTVYINQGDSCSKYIWNGERFVPEKELLENIVKRHTNKDNKDFEFMYDDGTSHPWSSYVSERSSSVLKLEMVHSDEFGVSYRVLVFQPVYWHKGEYRFPELGSEPTFVGYGTDYGQTPDCVDFSFICEYTGSEDTYFILSGYRANWDSILVGNMCPPIDSEEEIGYCVFKKQSWEDIQSWWNAEQKLWK